jgi:hypothetical protein
MECVYRDGVVENIGQLVTKGNYGTTPVLPLLTGTEVDGPTAGWYTHYNEGSVNAMHFPLLPHIGSKVRVIRGSKLESKYAPKAGIRYDGEYVPTSPS